MSTFCPVAGKEMSERSDVMWRSTSDPSAPAVTKLLSRVEAPIAAMATPWGRKAWAFTNWRSVSSSLTRTRNQAWTLPLASPTIAVTLPRMYSSAVMGSVETWATSVRRGFRRQLPVVEVALLGGGDHGLAAPDADAGDLLAVLRLQGRPVLRSLVVGPVDEDLVVPRARRPRPCGRPSRRRRPRAGSGPRGRARPARGRRRSSRGPRASGPRTWAGSAPAGGLTRPSAVPSAMNSPSRLREALVRVAPAIAARGSCRTKEPSAALKKTVRPSPSTS